jgi:hypothetical protein
MGRYHYVFPKWSNLLLPGILIAGPIVPLYVALVVAYGVGPSVTDVGYQPEQPVAFSHALHAGQLGMDCRYCHNTVERTAHAVIPPTQTCMNCHTQIHKDSPKLQWVRDSYGTGDPAKAGLPIPWVRVHDLPDYAYFNHAAHVSRGVSCVECHGRIDRMEVVTQVKLLTMGWCLECHRNPVNALRDPDLVTDLAWSFDTDPEAQHRFESEAEYHAYWKELNQINPSDDCSTCHR